MKRDHGSRAAWRVAGVALAMGLQAAACRGPKPAVELLRAEDALQAATAAGRDLEWVKGQSGKPIRIHDVVRRTLPASPPSRLEYEVDVPEGGRLSLACGIAEDRHDQPGVEFVVKIVQGGREKVLATEMLDPASRPKHRRWVPLDLDLREHAGPARLVLETRGFETGSDDPRRAFWGAPVVTSPKKKAPLAILYLVDTLRADHTTPYGYARDTTPELAKFAQDAVVFDAAISTSSWTKPSVASIFTSQLPGRHRAVQLRDPLEDRGNVTLAEMLKAKGYFTGAAIANSVIYSAGTHFEQGFDVYTGIRGAGDKTSKIVEAAPVIDKAVEWIDARAGLPGLLYLHLMDPHVPYTPPAPFDRKYEPHPSPEYPADDPRTGYREPIDRDRLIAQYDGEIAYGDQEFGRLVRELKSRGLYDDALIVFTADHGEEFLDHGMWTHGKSVHDELVRVPLIVKFPGGRDAGKRVAAQVQTMDILPTVLEGLGLPGIGDAIAGRPLQAVVRNEAPERAAVSEISHRGYVAYGMRTAKDKYIRRFSPEEKEQYFDLVADPREQTNRVAEAAERSHKLKGDLQVAMVGSLYRHNLKLVGHGTYSLKLRCGGWIDGIESVGFGTKERATLDPATQTLTIEVAPRAGAPREVIFSVRPMGAPVWVDGTRDGRPLAAKDVFMAQEAIHPSQVPFKLPEVESESDRADNMLAPPGVDSAGLHVWLTLLPGTVKLDIDPQRQEELCALGYVKCPGQ